MASPPPVSADQAIAFGTFRLLRSQQLLLEADRPVSVGSRALALLVALVERAGEVVSKEELIAKVWPETHVEEGNLRVHMAALRRALGDGQGGNRYVTTIPGRGYSFVAPVTIRDPERHLAQKSSAHRHLPAPVPGMVGRADAVASLAAQMPQRRFVTLVGPGGIGKTTVAIAVAHKLSDQYSDGIAFIDFVPLSDPLLLASKLASVLALSIHSDEPLSGLVAYLRTKNLLLVLDNCEHVIESAATLAEEIYKNAPGVHLLATSREPLRATGERVHRLAPLESAPASTNLTAAEALTFAGIQLFVDRAAAASNEFQLTDADAPMVADLCRRLDGIPLAIELAAGRVDAFGLRGLSERLDDRFRLLTGGRRTALPRHQTLGATLDWSYEILPEKERTVLRQLGVFPGDFSLEAAAAVSTDPQPAQFVDHLAILITKSLVTTDLTGKFPRYRLLETTRLYCLEKLTQSGEHGGLARRHAEYCRDLFAQALAECDSRPKDQWLAQYAPEIDNLRAALDWAFALNGDPELGVALTISGVPLWAQLSLVAECRRRVEHALAHTTDARSRMRLSAALGWSLTFSAGTAREIRSAWSTALELAEQFDDKNVRFGAMWGLWVDRLNNGAFREAYQMARKFAAIVERSQDSIDPVMADRLLGKTHYFLGEQREARKHLALMFDRYIPSEHQTRITRFQFDQGVTARYFQARVLWLLGFADQAMQTVESNIEEARSKGHALTLSSALGQGACPIALFTGDLGAAERFGEMLLEHSQRHSLHLWHGWARCFMGVVQVKRGDVASGLRTLRQELAVIGDGISLPRYLLLLGELAACLGQDGQALQALQAIDTAIARCEQREELWCIAELFRVKGELFLLVGADGADQCFSRSRDWAQRQGTLSWELRAAMSLARLQRARGHVAEARAILEEVYGRFSEGFDTVDLKNAKDLIADLQPRPLARRVKAR